MVKVLKFGGTSMANADSIRQVGEIIRADKAARIIVVSAPGKREKTDTKVTDMLYECYRARQVSADVRDSFDKIRKRFDDIIEGLGIEFSLKPYLDRILYDLEGGASVDYMASRGEYLSALVTAAYLGYKFIDAKDIVKFNPDGSFNAELTNELCASELKKQGEKGVVVPGFYGQTVGGDIKTFSRGGSDVTGAILARAVNASVYENWTDVDGFMTCDPRIVKDPEVIRMLTYRELRELSYMGANVLHPESIFPVRKSNIPIRIRNTFNPQSEGTMIVSTNSFLKGEYTRPKNTITGIAGKTDFLAIHLEKQMMNNECGFARKVLSVLEDYGINLEHMPSGIDTLTVVFESIDDTTVNRIMEDIRVTCEPDRMELVRNLALVAVVGHGMSRRKGTAMRICNSLYHAGVNIRMIDQGSSEFNVIVAVENADYEKAISALYNEFHAS